MFQARLSGVLRRAAALGKTHAAALMLALLVGALYAGPDIYRVFSPGYQGINTADSTDADFYLTNINKSYELSGLLGNPYLYEYRDVRNTFQYFLVELALGKVGKVLHLPIDVLVIGMGFVFPALLTILLYAFALSLSGSRLAAFFVGAAMLLGNEIVHPDGLANLFNTFLLNGGYQEFLTYSRPVNPQVSGLFFFAVLWGLCTLFRNPRSKRALVLCGLGVGLFVYIYIYFWAFLFAVLGVLFLYSLFSRNWPLTLGVCIAGAISVLFMMPFLLVNASLFLHGSGGALTQTISTHAPIVEKVILLPLFLYALIYLWAWWSRGQGKMGEWSAMFANKYTFVLLLLITGVVVSNQQVITGKSLFQQHFHFFTNIPMFLFAMSFLFVELVLLFPRFWREASVLAASIVLVWFVAGVQISSYRNNSEESVRYQELAPIFAYVRERAPMQSVILANPYLSTRFTIYTQAFSYSTGAYDTTFQVPQERIVHDYFVTLALRGVTGDSVRSYLYEKNNRVEVGYTIFTGTYWRDLCGSGGCFPDSVLEDLITGYKEFQRRPLLQNITAHKVDFLLWDTKADPKWRLGGIIADKPVVVSGDFKLYAIKP